MSVSDKAPLDVNSWVSKFKDDFGFLPTRIAEPTKAQPGSPRKVEVLAKRISEGRPLFVRGDTTLDTKCKSYLEDIGGTNVKGDKANGAQYSRCGKYRYRMWRYWDEDIRKPVASFIVLSPGMDTHTSASGEVRRLHAYALRYGFRGFEVVSLFSYRAETLGELLAVSEPIGYHNDRAIRLVTEATSCTVCCWGDSGWHRLRSARVLWGLRKRVEAKRLLCFGLSKKRVSPIRPTEFRDDGNGRSVEKSRMVSQPVSVKSAGVKPVTIQLPFSEVDYNDVDDVSIDE